MATNLYNPNTGALLKPGQSVVNQQTGQVITQGTTYVAPAPAPTPAPAPRPTPAPASTYAAPAPTIPTTYKIVSGDTASRIAQKLGTTVQALQQANPQYQQFVSNPNYIQAGWTLNLPTTAPASTTAAPVSAPAPVPITSTPATSSTYKIVGGDTLSQIAQRQGTTVQELMAINPQITDPNKIYAGDTLNLPSAQPVLPATPPVVPPTTSTDTGQPVDTGDPILNKVLEVVTKLLSDAEAQGKKINPNVDLAALSNAALAEAIAAVDPYYASQIKSIRGDLEQGITSLAKEYELAKEERAAQYRQTLGIQQESEAGKGTIFSGGRIQREREMGTSAARGFESLASQTAESAMRAGRETERTIGSLGMTGYQMPTISQYGVSPTSQLTPTSRTLWSPTGGITGSLERERDIIREQTRRELLKKKQEESLWQ